MPAVKNFDEIRALLRTLPASDTAALQACRERDGTLTKPPGSLGRLEEIAEWLCAWQGAHPPRAERLRVCIFAGNHGVAALGVSAFPAEVTVQMVKNYENGGAAINQLCRAFGAELSSIALDLDHPTADFTKAPAMTEAECCAAFSAGMLAAEAGGDVLCPGEMGIANTTPAAAISHALFGGDAVTWTGPGSGISAEGVSRKTQVVAEAIAFHGFDKGTPDPLRVLQAVGGRELAAMAGLVLGGRLARIPVLLDGYVCSAAAAVLHAALPGALDHCLAGHASAEPGHRLLLERLGKNPLLMLGMRLGEGSGAAAALGLIKAAAACHNGMATFASAGVSAKVC